MGTMTGKARDKARKAREKAASILPRRRSAPGSQPERPPARSRLGLGRERRVEIDGPGGRPLARWEGRTLTWWGAMARADAERTDRQPRAARTGRGGR